MDWFYRDGDLEIGPVSASVLKQLAMAGKLEPDQFVRPANKEKWYLAHKVDGLFSSANRDSAGYAHTKESAEPNTPQPKSDPAIENKSSVDSTLPAGDLADRNADVQASQEQTTEALRADGKWDSTIPIVQPMDSPEVYSIHEEVEEEVEEREDSNIKRVLDSAGIVIDFVYRTDKLYVCTHTGLCVAWDLAADHAIRVTQIEDGQRPTSLAVSHNGEHVVVAGDSKDKSSGSALHHWKIESEAHPSTILVSKSRLTKLTVSRHGFICWLSDGKAFASRSGRELDPRQFGDAATGIGSHKGTDVVAIGKSPNQIELWDVTTNSLIQKIATKVKLAGKRKKTEVDALAVSPNGEFILASSGDNPENSMLRLWNVKYASVAFEFEEVGRRHTFGIKALQFIDDSQFLSVSADSIHLWSINPPQHRRKLCDENGAKATIDLPNNRLIMLPPRPFKGDQDKRAAEGIIIAPIDG